MLERLQVRDLALIASLDLEPGPGLNLVTGETGSGKSILLDSLGFALGSRASAELVRSQAEAAQVTASFSPGPEWARRWKPWFAEKGLPWEDGQLILKREISRSGKGRAWINGEASPVGLLAELGRSLVDFHGQHDHQALLRVEEHRGILDRFGGLDAELKAVAEAWEAHRQLRRLLEGPQGDAGSRRRQLEFLDFQLSELEALAPREGEWPGLRESASLQASAGKRAEALARAQASLAGEEEGALAKTQEAWAALKRLAEMDSRHAGLAEQLERGLLELKDVADSLRGAAESLELDPAELERLQGRLHAWEALSRKHRCEPEALPAVWAGLSEEQASLRLLLEDEAGLRLKLAEAARVYAGAALKLGRAREGAAGRLGTALGAELRELLGAQACFEVQVRRRLDAAGEFELEGSGCRGDAQGVEDVEFLFSPNAGEPLKPLARIASGGELSRLALALKGVFSGLEGAASLVFDEIDAGISGRVAGLVGARIAALAGRHQVLCITHLPQIACLPARHFKVSKRSEGGLTRTELEVLDGPGRVRELASLVADAEPGSSALAHAQALLQAASAAGKQKSSAKH